MNRKISYSKAIEYILLNFQNLKLSPNDLDELKKALEFLKMNLVQRIAQEQIISQENTRDMIEQSIQTLTTRLELLTGHEQQNNNISFLKGKIDELEGLKACLDNPDKFFNTLLGQTFGENLNSEYKRFMKLCAVGMHYYNYPHNETEGSRVANGIFRDKGNPLFLNPNGFYFSSDANPQTVSEVKPNLPAIRDFLNLIRNPDYVAQFEEYNKSVAPYDDLRTRCSKAQSKISNTEYLIETFEPIISKVLSDIQKIESKLTNRDDECENVGLSKPGKESVVLPATQNPVKRFFSKVLEKLQIRRFTHGPFPSILSVPTQIREIDELNALVCDVEKALHLNFSEDSYKPIHPTLPNHYNLGQFVMPVFNKSVAGKNIFGESLVEGKTALQDFKDGIYRREEALFSKSEAIDSKRGEMKHISTKDKSEEIDRRVNVLVKAQIMVKLAEFLKQPENRENLSQTLNSIHSKQVQTLKDLEEKTDTERNVAQKAYDKLPKNLQYYIKSEPLAPINLQGIRERYLSNDYSNNNNGVSPFVASLILEAIMHKHDLSEEDLEKMGIYVPQSDISYKQDQLMNLVTQKIAEIAATCSDLETPHLDDGR